MASAIELMLKSMGFDPAAMVRDMQGGIAALQTTMQSIDSRLAKIETEQVRARLLLEMLAGSDLIVTASPANSDVLPSIFIEGKIHE